ncbi:uncharacterized protein K02A2.6 [Trichonephila clavipes]|nr:uncharacterized protein K02A2.6 [Trichonephila clavipes]
MGREKNIVGFIQAADNLEQGVGNLWQACHMWHECKIVPVAVKCLLAPGIPSDQTARTFGDPRSKVPFALKGRVGNEIDRLEREASDASPVGIGCVLSHVYPDDSERPIAFASRTLSGPEKKYSQIDKEALSIETGKDIRLGPLLKALREGKDLQGREAQYTIEDGYIMYGQRVCILKKFQKYVLEELHAGHLGIIKMKAIDRLFVYWKIIDKDIGEAAKNCVDCARHKTDPTKTKVHYWEYPSMPWELAYVDFAGPIFTNIRFFYTHSKWLEIYPMKVTTTKKTIKCLRDSFARFGLPRVLVSNNGSQFTSYEFQRFMQGNGVKHKTSAPFKPSSNEQAERYFATLKQSLRAMRKYEYDAMLF